MSIISNLSSIAQSDTSEHIWNEKLASLQSVRRNIRKGKNLLITNRNRNHPAKNVSADQPKKLLQPSSIIPQDMKSRLPRRVTSSKLSMTSSKGRSTPDEMQFLSRLDPGKIASSHMLIEQATTPLNPRVIDNTNYRNYLKKRYPFIAADNLDLPKAINKSKPRKLKMHPKADAWPDDAVESPKSYMVSHRQVERPTKKSNAAGEMLQSYTYFLENHRFAWEYVEELIYGFLDDDFIPDVLIETISMALVQHTSRTTRQLAIDTPQPDYFHNTAEEILDEDNATFVRLKESFQNSDAAKETKKSQYSNNNIAKKPFESSAIDILHDLLRELLPDMIRDLVSQEVVEQSNNILARLDVSEMMTTSLLDGFVHQESYSVVRECIRELADDELENAACFDLLSELLSEAIREHAPRIVQGAWGEAALDSALEDLVLESEIRNMSYEVAAEVMQHYDNKLRQHDMSVIQLLAREKPLSMLAFDYLTHVLDNQSDVVGNQRVLHRHLEALFLEIVLHQDEQWRRARDLTLSCHPLRIMHQRAAADVALSVLTEELKKHADEDLCDLDFHEVRDPQINRFIRDADKTIYATASLPEIN